MKLNKKKRVCIVGLGLIGGAYAMKLTKEGYAVDAIDVDPGAVAYALEKEYILRGASSPDAELLTDADLVVFGLYPHTIVPWLREHQDKLKAGAVLTDVAGVKSSYIYEAQAVLRKDLEYVAAHPMAGREVSGVQNSDPSVFEGANYIVVPTDANSFYAIETVKGLGETLGFARVSSLPPKAHDEMIGFVSQLTHAIAMSLMTCSQSDRLVDYTGDSFRDLTRIARINEDLWSELFLSNREALVRQMEKFGEEFSRLTEIVREGDEETLRKKMRRSTARRALFDKPKTQEEQS